MVKSRCQTSALKSGQILVPNKISTTPLVPSRSSQIQRSEVQSALVTVYRATRGRTVVFTCDLAVPRNRSTSPAVLLFRYSNQSRALMRSPEMLGCHVGSSPHREDLLPNFELAPNQYGTLCRSIFRSGVSPSTTVRAEREV